MTHDLLLASASDAAEISAFAHASFKHTFAHLYDPADLAAFLGHWNRPEDLTAQTQSPDWALRYARFADGRIAGFIKLGPIDFALPADQPVDGAIELHQLYVDEAAKGTGLADALIQFGLGWAKERGNILYLSVYSENYRAQKFYIRYGFYDVARNPFLVGSHVDEDRIWRADL